MNKKLNTLVCVLRSNLDGVKVWHVLLALAISNIVTICAVYLIAFSAAENAFDYSAIDELKDGMSSMENEIRAIETIASQNKSSIGDIEDNVDSVKDSVESISDDVDSIRRDIRRF